MPLIVFVFLLTLSVLFLPAPTLPLEGTDLRNVEEDMVLIPEGTFKMGCDRFGEKHGAPSHLVYLDAFMIDKFEVTNQQYEEVFPEHFLRRSPFSQCDLCPATKMSWYEAADYCHLVGKSLPSEAQWEKPPPTGTGVSFPGGRNFSRKKTRAAAD